MARGRYLPRVRTVGNSGSEYGAKPNLPGLQDGEIRAKLHQYLAIEQTVRLAVLGAKSESFLLVGRCCGGGRRNAADQGYWLTANANAVTAKAGAAVWPGRVVVGVFPPAGGKRQLPLGAGVVQYNAIIIVLR